MDSLFSSLNGIFPFIIAAIFIWRVVSIIAKTARSGPPQTLPLDVPLPKSAKQLSSPINWSLIRENLEPEEIRECFNTEALSRGVPVADLPKYVNLNKLRTYFTEEDLADLIDLDLFAQSEDLKKIDPETLVSRLAQPSIHVQFQQEEEPRSKPRKTIDPLKLGDLEINLQSGILFWQIIQPCPGMRSYRRFITI